MTTGIERLQHYPLPETRVDEFALTNSRGSRLTVLNYGAMVQSLKIRLVSGELRDIVFGCDMADILTQDAYFGATIGRYANRIAGGRFAIGGQQYQLSKNQHGNCLHGGECGFDKHLWATEVTQVERQPALVMTHYSEDGDQGFPGNLQARAVFRWRNDNELEIQYQAQVDQPCPVCLTSHGYYNLAGYASDCRQHHLQISAERYLPVNSYGIPEQGLQPVTGTDYDFTNSKRIRSPIDRDKSLLPADYDHSFRLIEETKELTQPAATLIAPDQLLTMELFTNQPALQLYTARYIEGRPARNGGVYQRYDALCLEPQVLPDTPNHPEFGRCILHPGEIFENCIRLKFTG